MAALQASFCHVSSNPSTESCSWAPIKASWLPKNPFIISAKGKASQHPHAIADFDARTEEGERQQKAAELAAAVLTADALQPTLHASSKEIMDDESRLFVQTYARCPVVFVKGYGCKLYDAEGKEYLDMTAGIAVNALGHGDQSWIEAIVDQASVLAHVSNLYYSEPQVSFPFFHRSLWSIKGKEASFMAAFSKVVYMRVDF